MFGWSWTEASVLGSQVFGQASMESCDMLSSSLRGTFIKYGIICIGHWAIKANNVRVFTSIARPFINWKYNMKCVKHRFSRQGI